MMKVEDWKGRYSEFDEVDDQAGNARLPLPKSPGLSLLMSGDGRVSWELVAGFSLEEADG